MNGPGDLPAGDVAASTPAGDGRDVLLYSPGWDTRVRALARRRGFEGVATAGGRVAFVGSNAPDAGVRVSVLVRRRRGGRSADRV